MQSRQRTLSDRVQTLDDATLNMGLLMESAHAHQQLAESHLEKLRAHTQDLDAVVRDEIRRTLSEELRLMSEECRRATEAFRRVGRGGALRSALWSAVTALLCTGIPVVLLRWALPSESAIAELRARHAQLTASVAILKKTGGRVEWRHCGDAERLCVRVDRTAPAYGAKADFYVVAGY